MRLHFAKATAAASLALITSACSGAKMSLPPLVPAAHGASDAAGIRTSGVTKGYGIIRFRIAVPGRTRGSGQHRATPAFVSSATRKVAVTVRGANQSSSTTQKFRCTAVCTGKIVAPLGIDAITIQLEDKKSRVLSRGSATVVVFKSGNAFDFTLDGVPASVALVPQSNVLPVVPASTGYLNFDARDADGRIITPDGHYTDANGNPLVFSLRSNSAALRLSVKTVSAPGTPIAFAYNGKQHVGTITLTPRANRGIHTTVAFHATSIRLVPGIASRISPPMPIDVLTATQVPIPGGSTACGGFPCDNPNAIFVIGNSGAQQVALAYNTASGAYGVADGNDGDDGPFAFAPVDLGANGFRGFFDENGTQYGVFYMSAIGATYGGGANPCPATYNVPIGADGSPATFCSIFIGPVVYDATNSVIAADGYERKIRVLGTTDYIVTADSTSPREVYSYTAHVSTLVPGAIGVGTNATSPSVGYYGDQDGTVKIIGGATVATFSHPVEDVVGSESAIYAAESGRIFGAAVASGRYETAPLPVGNVVEVVTGVGGVPMLVESDGTLDVMGM